MENHTNRLGRVFAHVLRKVIVIVACFAMMSTLLVPTTDAQTGEPTPVEDPPAEDPPAEDPPAEDPPAEDPPAEDPPAEDPPAEDPPAEDPPAEDPPAEDPPAEDPPAEDPPAEDPPAEDPPAEDPPAEDPPAEDPPAEDPPAEDPPAEDPPAEDPPAEDPPAEDPIPAAVDNAGQFTTFTKTASPGSASVAPGQTFEYEIAITCTEQTGSPGGCASAQIVDVVPPPLVVDPAGTDSVPSNVGSNGSVTVSGNTVTVDYFQPLLGGGTGLVNGVVSIVKIAVSFPANDTTVCAATPGGTITNTADATATNATAVGDSADVTCVIPARPSVEASKTMTPSSTVQGSGDTFTTTLTVQNDSTSVTRDATAMTISDQAAAFFNIVDFVGITSVTCPAGVATYDVTYNPTGNELNIPCGTAPAVPASPGTIVGYDVNFDGPIAPGSTQGSVVASHTLRDTRRDDAQPVAPGPANVTAVNEISADLVTPDGNANDPATEANNQATVTVAPALPKMSLLKYWFPHQAEGDLIDNSGDVRWIDLRFQNIGNVDMSAMTITEPGAGSPNTPFDNFDWDGWRLPGVTCPPGATEYTVTFTGTTALGTPTQPIACGTLPPEPVDPAAVTGVEVTFTDEIVPASEDPALGRLFFDLVQTTADLTTGPPPTGNHTELNTASAQGETASGATSAIANATDDLTVYQEDNTSDVEKRMFPTNIVAGTNTTINLSGSVRGNGRPDEFWFTDLGGSGAGGDFWTAFNGASVQVDDIPAYIDEVYIEYSTVADADPAVGPWVAVAGAAPAIPPFGFGVAVNLASDPAAAAALRYRIRYVETDGTGIPPNTGTGDQFEARLVATSQTGSGDLDGQPYGNCGKTTYVDGMTVESVADSNCDNVNVFAGPGPGVLKISATPAILAIGADDIVGTDSTTVWPVNYGVTRAGAAVIVAREPLRSTVNNGDGLITGNDRIFETFNLAGIDDIDLPFDSRLLPQYTTDGGVTWTTFAYSGAAVVDGDGYIESDMGVEIPAGSLVPAAGDAWSDIVATRLILGPRNTLSRCGTGTPNPADDAGNEWGIAIGIFDDCFLGAEGFSVPYVWEPRATYRTAGTAIGADNTDDDGTDATDTGVLEWVNCSEADVMAPDGSISLLAGVRPNSCAVVQLVAPIPSVDLTKSFTPPEVPLSIAPTLRESTMTITAENAGNAALTNLSVIDPSPSPASAPFDLIDLLDMKVDTSGLDGIAGGAQIPATITVTTVPPLGGPFVVAPNALVPLNDAQFETVTAFTVALAASSPNLIAVGGSYDVIANVRARLTNRTTGTDISVGPADNNARVETSGPGGTIDTDKIGTLTLEEPQFAVSADKTVNPDQGPRDLVPPAPGSSPTTTANLTIENVGAFAAEELQFVDACQGGSGTGPTQGGTPATTCAWFDAFNFAGFGVMAMPPGFDQVRVDAVVGGAVVPGAFASTPALPGAIADPTTVEGVIITMSHSCTAGGTCDREAGQGLYLPTDTPAAIEIKFDLRRNLRSDSAARPAFGTVTNVFTGVAIGDGGTPITDLNSGAGFQILDGTTELRVTKTPDGATLSPGAKQDYVVEITNTGTRDLTDPLFEDNFGPTPGFEYNLADPILVDAGTDLMTTPTNLQGTPIVSVPNTPAGPLSITWPTGEYLAPGQTIRLTIPITVTAGTPQGTQLDNEAQMRPDPNGSEPGAIVACVAGSEDEDVTIGGALLAATPNTCNSVVDADVREAEGLSITKFSRAIGSPDDPAAINALDPINTDPVNFGSVDCLAMAAADNGWVRQPCVATAYPGFQMEFKNVITNSGNLSRMQNLTSIDIFPHVGDRFLLGAGGPRGSDFDNLTLISASVSGTSAGTSILSYSAAAPALVCVSEVLDDPQIPCPAGSWDAPQAGATAMKIETSFATPFLRAQRVEVISLFGVPATVPAIADGTQFPQVDWNTFAYRESDTNFFGASNLAGVAAGAGRLKVTKIVSGPQSLFGVGPYVVDYSCVQSVVPALPPVTGTLTITGDFQDAVPDFAVSPIDALIPAGAVCTLTEIGTSGASSQTFTPDPWEVTITGMTDPNNIGDVDDATVLDETTQASLDNVYDAGVGEIAFGKIVDGDAGEFFLDQTFSFDVECYFLTNPALADDAANRSDITEPVFNEQAAGTLFTYDPIKGLMQFELNPGATVGTAGPALTLTSVPVGARCLLVETGQNGLVDPSTVTILPNPATVDAQDLVEVGVTNTYDAGEVGQVQIEKTVASVGTLQDWSFDFAIAVVPATDPQTTPADPVLTSADATSQGTGPAAPSGDVVSWTGIVEGNDYVITETSAAGFGAGDFVCTGTGVANGVAGTDVADNPIFTFTAGASDDDAAAFDISCAITNTAVSSAVQVTKTVAGSGLESPFAWEFEFTLAPDADPKGAQSVSGTGDASGVVQWSELVSGASYTLAETAQAGYTEGALVCAGVDDTDGDSSDETVTFVAPFGTEAKFEVLCTIENDTDLVDVEVNKTVEGLSFDLPWSFEFSITATSDVAPSLVSPDTVVDGVGGQISSDVVRWIGLVPGSEYVIDEVPADGYTSGTMTCAGVTDTDDVDDTVTFIAPLDDGDSTTTAVECEISNTADLYELSLTKEVDGPGATFNSTKAFGYSVECSVVGADGSTVTVPVDPASGTILDGETITVGGLPLGTDCVVTETDTGNAYLVTVNGETGTSTTETIGEDGGVVLVVNTFEIADIAITKTLAGDAAWAYADYVYEFSSECSYEDAPHSSSTFMLIGGETHSIAGLPLGAECVITETETHSATSTDVNGTVGTSTTVIAGGPAGGPAVVETADFTNTYEPVSLDVTKSVVGVPTDDDPFDFTVTCSLDGATIDDGLTGLEFSIGDGETHTIEHLPEGSICTLTEALSDIQVVLATATINGVETVTADITMDGDQAVEVVNTFLSTEASILVEKSTNGSDADTADEAVVIIVGEPVIWEYTVTNTGETDLADVTVVDDMGVEVDCGAADADADGDIDSLDIGETVVCTGEGTAADTGGLVGSVYVNVATATGQPAACNSPCVIYETLDPVSDTDPSHYRNPPTVSSRQPTPLVATPTPAPISVPANPQPPTPPLSLTGANSLTLATVALAMLAAGVLLVGISRRRRDDQ